MRVGTKIHSEYGDVAENLRQELQVDDVVVLIRDGKSTFYRTAHDVDLKWLKYQSRNVEKFYESTKERIDEYKSETSEMCS